MYRIYKITNKVNGKLYIGWTSKTIEERFDIHKKNTENIKRGSPKLIYAIRKYGSENFTIEEIWNGECLPISQYMENHYIKLYNTQKNGYNILDGGLNRKLSEETKKKISESHKGMKLSEETKEKLRNKIISNKTRENMSISAKNKIISNITKEKLSITNSGINNGFYGKKHSEETRKRMSESKKGKQTTSTLGKKHSEETKKKISESKKANNFNKQKIKVLGALG